MWLVFVSCLLLGFLFAACTPLRQAQTGISGAIAGQKLLKYDWGEVYCSQGVVCGEVEVVRVDIERRNGGRVVVTLKNRTQQNIVVSVHLQIYDQNGVVLLETNPDQFPLPHTQAKRYEMPGIFREGALVRVMLNTI